MVSKTTIIAVLLVIGVLLGAVGAATFIRYYYPSTGTIITVSATVKWAVDNTDVTTIDWAETENATAYEYEPFNITNTSNVNINLSLSYTEPSSSIIELDLSWNYTGQVLAPNQSIILALTQNVTATGDYSYTTEITVEEAI